MAFIRHRGKTYSVVYKILDENGEEHTTSETFATQKEADKRKKEIEYKQSIGKFEVQKCATLKELIEEYVQIYGHDKWGVSTYSGNVALINNYILPTIGDTKLVSINTHFMEKYYKDLLKMPAVKSTKNPDGTGTITESTVNEIHKVLRSCFRQAVKWDMMEKNPAVDATVPKAKKQEREIWTAEMLMQALEACDNKMLKIAFHLAFTATLRIGELMENAFYNKENLNPQMKAQDEGNSTITVPDGVDAELLMKVLGNPEMAALLTSLAKTMKV